MRVLVTGAGGLLGGRLAALLHGRGLEVLAAHRLSIPPPGPRPVLVDLTDEKALARLLDASRPDAVVHAAAIGRSNQCEERPDEAERVNARLPGTLARECRERGLRLVALSTDLVFGGDRAFLREDDPPGPLGVYGRTKLAGEEAVLSACPGAAVVRVAMILGRGHGARATSTESVADAVLRLLECPAAGRFHLGGPERISRYDLGLRVARLLGLPQGGIVAGRQADHAGPDRRAADVSLDSGRARRELGWEPRPIDEAIRESRAAARPG